MTTTRTPDPNETRGALRNLLIELKREIKQLHAKWDALSAVFRIDSHHGSLTLSQSDIILHRTHSEPDYAVLYNGIFRRSTLRYIDMATAGRDFTTAVLVVRFRKDSTKVDTDLYIGDAARPFIVTPETWWAVAEAVDPLHASS